MDTRTIAKELRLAHWTGVLKERNQSGLSINTFCKQIGISNKTYFYWQRKLREAACQELAGNEAVTHSKSLVPSGWAQLMESNPPELLGGLTVEINGCRINISAETDPRLLAKVCGVLKAL